MRGKLHLAVAVGANPRITPADAGKTQPAFTAEDFGRDHPRGCGEN